MGKNNINRWLFYWIDRLQITRRERTSIIILFSLVVLLQLVDIFIEGRKVPASENYSVILEEYKRKTEELEQRRREQEARYTLPDTLSKKVETQGELPSLTTKLPANEEKTERRININSAGVEELMKLPGIGRTYAQRIIEYRETKGEFKSVDALIKVKGIGEKTLEKLRPFIEL